MKHKGTVEILTPRLLLRRFTIQDVENCFQNWTSDKDMVKYLRWSAHKDTSETSDVIKHWIEQYTNCEFYQWAITLKKNEALGPIGTISVVSYDNRIGMLHIGYCIGSKWWNKGIMSEALSAIIKFMFEELQANRIESQHAPDNIASGKVMQKCGMQYEGILKQADYNNQGIVDSVCYAILAEEYYNHKC